MRSNMPVTNQSSVNRRVAGLTVEEGAGQARYRPEAQDLCALADRVDHACVGRLNAMCRGILGGLNALLRPVADTFKLGNNP